MITYSAKLFISRFISSEKIRVKKDQFANEYFAKIKLESSKIDSEPITSELICRNRDRTDFDKGANNRPFEKVGPILSNDDRNKNKTNAGENQCRVLLPESV